MGRLIQAWKRYCQRSPNGSHCRSRCWPPQTKGSKSNLLGSVLFWSINTIEFIDYPYDPSAISTDPPAPLRNGSHPDKIPLKLMNALWTSLCFNARDSITEPSLHPGIENTIPGMPWRPDKPSIHAEMDEIKQNRWGDIVHNGYFWAFNKSKRANANFNIGGYAFHSFCSYKLWHLSLHSYPSIPEEDGGCYS